MTTRLALQSADTRGAVQALAARSNWHHEQTFQADAHHGFEIVWRVPDRAVEVHYVEDGVVEQAYLALTGHPADVQAEIAALRGTLPCADLRQVLRRLRLSPAEDEQVELVRMLAVLGGEFYDNDVMHALADLLQSAETGARMQALLAVASLGWPTLRPLVTAAADSDEHAAVRQRAKEVLQAFDQIQRRGRAAVTPSRMDGPPS